MKVDSLKKVYFIGIGGIGISAVAKMFFDKGIKVLGSDSSSSIVTDKLKEFGIQIYDEHKKENIDRDVDLVIYTVAIKEDNPELLQAKNFGIKTLTYAESLGLISENMETVAISGTHGKTTTTAMIAKVMIDNNFDPTVIVGSLLNKEKSNLVVGKSKYFIVEACEYKRSFLNLNPKILIINNIDEDHLDYYKDLEDIKSAFRELAEKVKDDGYVLYNSNDKNSLEVVSNLKCNLIDYSKFIDNNITLNVPGKHNKSNAGVVLALSEILHIDRNKTIKSLSSFSGTWRRSEFKGKTKNGCMLYDDYAHHPKEVSSTLSGFREIYKDKKIVVFFQPHLFSRTKILFKEFGKCFSDSNLVYVLPIFKAREDFDPSINSEMLSEEINRNKTESLPIENTEKIIEIISKLDENHISITVGAGDMYKIYDDQKLKLLLQI